MEIILEILDTLWSSYQFYIRYHFGSDWLLVGRHSQIQVSVFTIQSCVRAIICVFAFFSMVDQVTHVDRK